MNGNVSEWVEDLYHLGAPERAIRGGSWFEGSRTRLLSSFRIAYPPGKWDFNRGFRIVLDPEASGNPVE